MCEWKKTICPQIHEKKTKWVRDAKKHAQLQTGEIYVEMDDMIQSTFDKFIANIAAIRW